MQRSFYTNIVFVVLLLLISYQYNYFDVLNTPPDGIHVWRQTDGLSMAYKYYEKGNSLFEPEMHNRLNDNGKAAGEFPGMYYLVSILYAIFGVHYWVYRGLWALIMLTGCFYLYRFSAGILKDRIWGAMIALFTYTSPVFIVYGISFMPDPVALSFTFISWFFILQYLEKKRQQDLLISVLLASLAVTLKITCLIPYIALGVVTALVLFVKRVRYQITSKEVLINSLPFAVLALFMLSWYSYASWYNKVHETSYFFMQIAPLWEIPADRLVEVNERLRGWSREYFWSKGIDALLLMAVLTILPFFNKHLRRSYYWITVFCLLGFFSFGVLFYSQFEYHDYYIIGLIFIVPVVSTFFVSKYQYWLKQFRWLDWGSKLAFALLLFFCIRHGASRAKERFSHKDYRVTTELREFSERLEDFGIQANDKVIIPHDDSPNVILYILNREGWTYLNIIDEPRMLQQRIQEGAKWMIITQKDYDNQLLDPYRDRLVHEYKGIRVYNVQ
jgi:hypothetical protein